MFFVFPGVYIFTWIAFLFHETWHKYVPNIPNEKLYTLYGWALFTDPQMYRLVHGTHHSQVNSYNDMEFHPLGEIKNKFLRKVYTILELIFGVMTLTISYGYILPRDAKFKEKFSNKKFLANIIMSLLFFGVIGTLSSFILKVEPGFVISSYAMSIWIGSFVLHHSQLIEHGFIIVDGDLKQRNMATRNLAPKGPVERIFLFLTHNDSREHVLHHTQPKKYLRPFIGYEPMPENSQYLDIKQYLKILKNILF